MLFCNNTSKPPVPFMYNQKNAKNKAIRKHKLPSHLTSNLKYKRPCGLRSIKALHKGLSGKKDKLNLIISAVANKYAVARVTYFLFRKI